MIIEIPAPRKESFQTLRITEMLASDIRAVLEIEQNSNLEPWTEESFLEELLKSHSSLLVARLSVATAELVVGYICFWLVADEVQILNIAVHQRYRRLGIGRDLLGSCLNCGAEIRARIAVLEVRSSNVPAQRLYSSLGFRAVGQRPDYYGSSPEPAVLMELVIAEKSFPWGDHSDSLQGFTADAKDSRAPILEPGGGVERCRFTGFRPKLVPAGFRQ